METGDVGWVYVNWNPCTAGHRGNVRTKTTQRRAKRRGTTLERTQESCVNRKDGNKVEDEIETQVTASELREQETRA